jgi:RHS repeat-associated protein
MKLRNLFCLLVLLLCLSHASIGNAQNLIGYPGGFSLSSSSVAAGTQVTVTFGILNDSNTPAGASSVRFYLSKDANIDPATDYALTGNVSGIPALGRVGNITGATYAVTLPTQDTITSLGGAGAFYIGMVVDSANQVNESNEGDNRNQGVGRDMASLTVTVPSPDLAGVDSRIYGGSNYFRVTESSVNWGDTIHVSHAVVNNTGGNAGPFNVKFYLSPDATIGDASDYIVFTTNYTAGLSGQTYTSTSSQSITLPAVNPFGAGTSFYVGKVVDADNQVVETNESNNKNQGSNIDRNATTISITPPTPSIYVTDSALPNNDNAVAFGSVANDGAGNARGIQKVTIVNKGKASLNMSSLALTGSPYFSIVEIASSTQNFINLSSLPRVIAANGTESWVVTLQYDPAATAAHTGTLTINSNDPTTPALAIALTGTGDPVPDIALATAEAVETDFGGVVQDGAGGFSANRTITFKNVGTGPLTVNQNGISLLTGTHYSILSITSSTQGAISLATGTRTMAAGGAETWDVVVKFDPTTTGLLKDGLKVLSNDPDEATFTASLTGTGMQPMHLVVVDSSGSPSDRAIAFPNVHADGAGKEAATATVTLTNTGEAPLTIPQNGLTFLTGTHFTLGTITSSTAGTIAGASTESWTVTLLFDPSTGGALTDTFRIASNDPSAATTSVSLTGTGLTQPALAITDSVAPANDLAVSFGAVLNDGTGNRTAQQTVTLKNLGTQPLVITQNGISLSGSSAFKVTSIISSTAGAINIGSATASARTLAPAQAETWTVTLALDPTTNTSLTGSLDIASNDPVTPVAHVALTGQGAQPVITLLQPSVSLNLSAGSVFNITWQDTYPVGDATIALYLDTDQNPATGLIPIATGLSSSGANFFAWRPDASLIGGSYYLYATITDGSVTGSSYTVGRVTIDATGAFKLRSSQEVTSADYAYEYEYNGQVYTGVRTLTAGSNLVTVTTPLAGGGTATNQFTVNLVPSLTHVETQTHDQLNRVETTKNGNGIVTTITYDSMGHVSRRSSSNGAVVDFSYDVLGRNTSMTDYTGSTFYEWDDLSRLTAVIKSKNATKGDSDDLKLAYEYDLAGHRTAVVYPGGERVEYTYDDAGRMKTVNNVTRSLLFTYTYNAVTGQLTKLTRPNGIETLYSYNGLGQLTTLRHQKTAGAVLVAEFFYTLDSAGKATELRTTLPGNVIRREGYSYDRFDRLTQVVYADDGVIDANDKTVIYSYDGNGNRLTQTTKINNVTTEMRSYAYGNENRLLKVTDQTGATIAEYRYDSAGNRIQKISPAKTTNYSYNERNLMVSFNDGTNFGFFDYDGSGQRVAATTNGVRKVFVNDPSLTFYDAVQERDSNGAIITATMFGIAPLASAGTNVTLDLDDRLGTAQLLTDGAGSTLELLRYDAFGAEASNNIAARFAVAKVEIGSGLYFMRKRFYDPDIGFFVGKDPLGFVAGTNGFVYVNGDPVNLIDPNGEIGTEILENIVGPLVSAYNGAEAEYAETGHVTSYGIVKGATQSVFAGIGAAEGFGLGAIAGAAGGFALGGIVAPYGGEIPGAFVGGVTGGVVGTSVGSAAGNHLGGVVVDRLYGKTSSASEQTISDIFSSVTPHLPEPKSILIKIEKGILEGDLERAFGEPKQNGQPILSDFGDSIFSNGSLYASAFLARPGGVLLDKAATLVGSNLSDLRGAVYDPVTGQFVVLGTEGSAAVKDINLDYLYTALQAVYGSAVPPFVTLDPPASAYTQWTDFGNGNGVFEIGENGGFIVRYNPIWSGEDTTVDVTINATWSGTNYTWIARFNCIQLAPPNPIVIYAGGRYGMKMVFNSWVQAPPAGVTFDTSPWTSTAISGSGSSRYSGDGQDTFTRFTLNNASASNYIVNSVQVYPARQHRKFGGRVEGSRVGWVMLEADRVMKCLSVGKDNLTGASYNSGTVAISGYQNMAERLIASGGAGGNIRMWFTPKEMTLKRHLDPVTGRASIVFDSASVACNTESFLVGLPQPAEAKAFADHLTANYDAFANLSFPCVDYNDPTGTAIINVKIFDMLRDVMRSVSLARFFRDNNVPVDMWWLNSWQPPYAYSPNSTPTA